MKIIMGDSLVGRTPAFEAGTGRFKPYSPNSISDYSIFIGGKSWIVINALNMWH